MEYLGFLSLGIAVTAVGLRLSILIMRAEPDQEYYRRGATSAKAKQVQLASLAKKLLHYHSYFRDISESEKAKPIDAASLSRKLVRYHAGLARA